MLDVHELKKIYRAGGSTQTVLHGISLRVSQGEIVALVGASGSGKTTLLNVLSGIDTPDAGSVRIGDTDIHAMGEPDRTLYRRQKIGFVFQFFNLIPTLTVGENIALPMELTATPAPVARERVRTLLGQVGLSQMADRFPETLSGGEQQRTALARALAHRPKLLLADEPTGNLDDSTGGQVISLLTDLVRTEQTTLVVVTHSDTVARAADRVLRLHNGKLLES